MALITCPDCGKKISDKATACPECGCPMGALQGGVLRVECFYLGFSFMGNCHITVGFCGENVRINSRQYYDFSVPADGKEHTATISCSKGLMHDVEIKIKVRSGESKKVIVTYDSTKFIPGWFHHEEMFITR